MMVKEKSDKGRLVKMSGMMLMLASIGSKFLGAIYRIPLTNILGAEGIGMYQLVFPIYALMITLSSSGIPTAISRLVAERNALSDRAGVRGIVRTSAILLAILGGFFMAVMLIISSPLSHVQGNDYLRTSYYAIAPSVLIVSGSSVFKGYFQGMLNLMPTAITQLVEQVVKMAVGLILSSLLLPYGVEYAVTGAILGLTIAELVSFLVMGGVYLRGQTKDTGIHLDRFRRYSEDILKVSLPIALSGIIFPVMQVIDSILIVSILRSTGVSPSRATALYGLLTGPVNTLINMPIVFTLALSIMIVPVISMSRIKRDADIVRSKCVTSIKLTYIIGLPAFIGMYVMADEIMRVLYPALSEADILVGIDLLRVSSISIVLLSQVQIYTSILEALDKTYVGMRALAISAVVKIVLSVILIKYMSIIGASIASVLTYLVAVIIDSIFLRKYLGKSENLFRSVTKIFVSGLVMACFIAIPKYLISNYYASLVVAVLLGVAIYAIFMVILKVMDEDELLSLPLGRLIVYLERKVRFPRR